MKAQNSREATHWKVYEIAKIGDFEAKKPTATIACGYPATYRHDMWASDTMAITCKACAEIAKQKGFPTQLGDEQAMF